MKKRLSIAFIIILASIKLHAQCDITGNLSICAGSTTQLSGNGVPVVSPWVSASPLIASVNDNGLVTGLAVGTSNITYTTTTCSSTVTLTVTAPSVTPTFTTVGPYCSGVTIPALPTTSDNGITGSWSPDINNMATTVYTFTPAAGQCAASAILTITVNPNITPTFDPVASICSGASLSPLPTTSLNGITGTWVPALDNTATTTYTFTPAAGECATSTTLTISVNPDITPTFDPVAAICSGVSLSPLPTTSLNGITGTWAPALDNTATTTYTFTPTAGLCAISTTLTITVNITPTAPTVGTITQPSCDVGTGSVILSGLPSSGTWTLMRTPGGITTTGTGTSATITGITSGTYTFSVTNASGCSSDASGTVTINTDQSTPTPPGVGTITQPNCSVATGSVTLNGLPPTGTWTLTRTPGGITYSGTGISYSISGLDASTYIFTVTNSSGCTSTSSGSVVINAQPSTPSAPDAGTISHPTCTAATGNVILNGLPTSGTWTLTRTPGGTTYSGTGISYTVSGLPAGTYSFTVTNASGCISSSSNNVIINTQPATPSAPEAGTINHPTCTDATGSIVLSGLPSSETWTITRTPGGTADSGTGTSTTISGLVANTYTFTVSNASGCISEASDDVVINEQPATPSAPTVGTITHPTCTVATGSVTLSNLPGTGAWTLTREQGGIATSGTGTSYTISGLDAGTYSYTVTNASGCTSLSSANVIVNNQPTTPTAPEVGTITHPTCEIGSGSVILSGLQSTGTWTLTRTPGGTTTTGTGSSTILTGLPSGSYTFTATNASGCISTSSVDVVINANPPTPTPPVVGTITQPTCSMATGIVVLNGLPAAGTWTLTSTPGGTITTGTGTSTTLSGLTEGSYTFSVTPESGCTSLGSASITINAQPLTPSAPSIGTITHPTCTVPTGGVILNGLPGTGTWTLTRTPAGTTTGTGTSTSISGIAAGTYTYTVTNSSGCISAPSANLIINVQPSTPSAPTIGTITHPTCTLATGSAVLNGLPATGTWSVIRTPGGTITSGTGGSATISGIPAGIFTFTVTIASGCTSEASGPAVINAQPPTPTAPVIGIITQPSLNVSTGSVVLNGLPATGVWTLIRTPGNTITTGSGASTTISGLVPGTYIFNVSNASGCTSQASSPVGLFTLKLFGPDQKILHSNDTLTIENSDAGYISISVETNTDWTVSENSLWLKAEKESGTSKLIVTYFENISAVNKVAPVRISYTANPEMVVNIQQKARVSQLNVSKFENVKIFPNPANDYVYLNFNEEEFEKILVSISNMQGYIISTEEFNNLTPFQSVELDVSVIPNGKYFIIISDGINHKTFHLIKF